ncbi:AAA family ATPase [Streptomyces sp. NPDC048825]|uniref:helix-turn-helix transcriptional regulator n=1 Tax=Streptomyces sp. NPDC048825 TaxID=3365592 RepID=UPI0037100923
MSFVGRDRTLAEIDGALAGLSAVRPPAFALSGEPGIGKTRLLTELAARADARGCLVLEGRAAEFERDTPFAVFVDALDDYLAGAGARALQLLNASTVAHLATAFPAVTAPAQEPVAVLQAERYRIHRAVRSLLDALAVSAPVVLVLDDMHWADEASAELFAHLLTHPPSRQVLVATAYRPAQLGDRIRAALERGVVHEIGVAPLSRADAERLLGDAVRPDAVEALYAESGGNPFYLIELARDGRVRPVAPRPEGDVPPAVSTAIDREIAELPAEARLLAQGGAVAGEPFLIDAAATAAGSTTEAALSAIDQLLTGGLVVRTDVPGRFRFRHPVVRRAVYESAGAGWRIAAHRRLAAALRDQGASPVDQAHHVAAAAEPGDTAAIDVLASAGHALSVYAPAIAADRFEAALRLLPHGDQRRVDLLVPLATALGGSGRLHESRSRLDEALALLPPQAAAPRAGLTAFCAAIEHLIGEHAAAHGRLVDTLTTLPDRNSAEAATLLAELAADALWRSDWSQMGAWTNEACEVARAVGARPVEAQGLALRAWAEFGTGRIPSALTLLDDAEAMVDALPDAELAGQFGATFYLARAAFMLERYESAVRHADRGLALGRATGQGELFLSLLTAKSAGLRMLGRLREADEADRAAVEGARLIGHDQVLALALLDRVASATAAGDLELAASAGEEAYALSARLGTSPASVVIGFLFGEVLLASGQPDRSVTIALEGLGDPDGDSFAAGGRSNSWSLLARAEAERGRLAEAQKWIDRLDGSVSALEPLGLPRCQTEYARGHVLLASGDPEAAVRAAMAAAESADRIRARVEAGRARLLAGRALGAAGDRDGAIALLEQARTEFEEYDARRYHDQTVQELRRLGRRIGRGGRRAAGDEGFEALSEREREIAELVAEGRTNKEIGDALLISTRTVERHLSHIFGKLGVSSRAGLGSVVERARR